MKILSRKCNDIAHILIFAGFWKCLLLSCYINDDGYTIPLPKGIHCSDDFESYHYLTVTPGYWFSNSFICYIENCPHGHCNAIFDLYASIYFANFTPNALYPASNDQCASYWTGLACGECDENYSIIHDSTRCADSSDCNFKSLTVFFLISLLYWIMVISLLFVLLHFRFNITAGYAYGTIFFYSILEQTVNASYIGTQNDQDWPYTTTTLSILSSIGNMKPPFQL